MKTAFLVDDDVVHGGSPLSCVHSANSERGHLPDGGSKEVRFGVWRCPVLMTLEKRDFRAPERLLSAGRVVLALFRRAPSFRPR
jgi:hypothetical protein